MYKAGKPGEAQWVKQRVRQPPQIPQGLWSFGRQGADPCISRVYQYLMYCI